MSAERSTPITHNRIAPFRSVQFSVANNVQFSIAIDTEASSLEDCTVSPIALEMTSAVRAAASRSAASSRCA